MKLELEVNLADEAVFLATTRVVPSVISRRPNVDAILGFAVAARMIVRLPFVPLGVRPRRDEVIPSEIRGAVVWRKALSRRPQIDAVITVPVATFHRVSCKQSQHNEIDKQSLFIRESTSLKSLYRELK